MGIDKPPKRPPEIVIAASNSSSRSKKVADFICTGTSDQTIINTAIGLLPSTGGELRLTEGTFNISAPIIINKGINFKGSGQFTQIFLSNASNSRMIEIAFTTGQSNLQHNIIENLFLNGNKSNQTSGTEALKLATSTDYPRDLVIRNIWIDSYKGHGITAAQNSGHHHYYDHLSVEVCDGAGLNLVSSVECLLNDCLLYYNWYGCIVNSVNVRTRIMNCRIDNNSYEGIKASAWNNLFVIGNDFKDNGRYAVNTYASLYLAGSNAIVQGNKFMGTNAKYGIQEVGSANKNIILGNVVNEGSTGKILVIGANTLNEHNIIA